MLALSRKMSPTITDMIRFDHSHVLLTFHQYTIDKKPRVRKALADTICSALEIHATLEEEIFYPEIRRLNGNEPVIRNSVPEHDQMRHLIDELRITDPKEVRHQELVLQLMRDVIHHVADEETVLLNEAENMLSKEQLRELGVKMTKRRMQLLAPQAGSVTWNTVVGFSASPVALAAGVIGGLCAVAALAKRRPATAGQAQAGS